MLLLLACVRAYMPPPAELAGVADVWSPGALGALGVPVSVGAYRILEPACQINASITNSSGPMEWQTRKERCTFSASSDVESWAVDCLRLTRTVGRRLDDGAVLPEAVEDGIVCGIVSDVARWELVLEGGGGDGWSGRLWRSGRTFTVAPAWARTDEAIGVSGVVISENGVPRAALDYVRAGTFWVDPTVDVPGPLLAASIAHFLYRVPVP